MVGYLNYFGITLCLFLLFQGVDLSVNFRGFQTIYYLKKGCTSSACEGVEILNDLAVSFGPFISSDILYRSYNIYKVHTDRCGFFCRMQGRRDVLYWDQPALMPLSKWLSMFNFAFTVLCLYCTFYFHVK